MGRVVERSFRAGKTRARRILADVATPRTLDDQGRMVGDYLLALDDAGAYLW